MCTSINGYIQNQDSNAFIWINYITVQVIWKLHTGNMKLFYYDTVALLGHMLYAHKII